MPYSCATVMIAALLAQPTIPPATTQPDTDGFPKRIQTLLGIPAIEGEMTTRINDLVGEYAIDESKQSDAFNEKLDKLVHAINQGFPMAGVWNDMIASAQVQNAGSFPVFGNLPVKRGANPATLAVVGTGEKLRWTQSIYQNDGFHNYVKAQAAAMASKDPTKAKEYARALTLLQCQDPFDEWLTPAGFAEGLELRPAYSTQRAVGRPEFELIMENRPLQKFLVPYAARTDVYYGSSDGETFAKAFQEILDREDGSITTKDVDRALGNMTQLRGVLKDSDIGFHWRTTNLTWQFLNAARKRKAPEAIKGIEDYIKAWRDQTPLAFVKRWLNEALIYSAEPPSAVWHPPMILTPVK